MPNYDPIRELIDKARAMCEVWSDWCMDYYPEYAALLAEIDRADRWVEDPREVEVR